MMDYVLLTFISYGSLMVEWSNYGSTLLAPGANPHAEVVWEGGVKNPFLSLLESDTFSMSSIESISYFCGVF